MVTGLRRRLLLVGLAAAGLVAASGARAEIALTDAAEREVRLAAPATRIATNESLLLLSLALIDPDPVARIAGWAAPRRIDPGMVAAFRQRFPGIDDIPVVGAVLPANASVETILSVRPDLFVVSLWQPDWDGVADRLQAAGVPVIFLDGPGTAGLDPTEATAFAVGLLGKAIGREAQADEFAGFLRAHAQAVARRLDGVTDRPKVLIDAFAGGACCSTPGSGNRLTQLMALAGGRSIGAGVVPGYDGQLSPEHVLEADPEIYIGTGAPHLAAQGGLVVGGGVDRTAALASLREVLGRDIRGELAAVREGRAFAVSHQLSISALSILVLECFATWTHPDLFADLDPAGTLAEINRRFLPVPLDGTFWIGLGDAQGSSENPREDSR
ncbi:ABC transporter substrate-binding protein [Inquilinus limosus]|uniref:ABC transporter substrate-binding protein n=1 Tax=Inquilinus limosus TaxID=171674 RepID=UPI003F1646C6